MVVKDGKTLYRVQYKVQEGDTPINMRASVESLEDLHRMLCSMDGFRTPPGEWALLELHEDHRDGTVSLIPQRHLAQAYDHLYGFGQTKKEEVEEKEEVPWGTIVPWTPVHIVRRKNKQPLASEAKWWKEVGNAY